MLSKLYPFIIILCFSSIHAYEHIGVAQETKLIQKTKRYRKKIDIKKIQSNKESI